MRTDNISTRIAHDRGDVHELTIEERKREIQFRTAMTLANAMLKYELISPNEHQHISDIFAEKYQPIWANL